MCLFRSLFFLIISTISLNAQTIAEADGLIQKGKFKDATAILENLIRNDENNAEAHSKLGLLFLNRQNPNYDIERAVEETEKAIEINPNNADFHYNYGIAIGIKTQTAGVFKQAFLAPKVKNAFKRAVELSPKHVLARIGLAQFYMMAPSIVGGDEDEAWKQIDEVIKYDEVQGRIIKATFFSRKKKNDEAEKEFKALTDSKPNDWRIWHRYGYFCLRLNRANEAVQHFWKYVELRPDTADSYQSLAEALLKKGDIEQALVNLSKSLSIDKEYVPAIISLGEAYQAKGLKREAKEAYQHAISITRNEYYKKQAEKKLKEVN